MELELVVKPPFGFRETVFSHGWVTLAPFQWDPEAELLSRVEALASGQVVLMKISDGGTRNHDHVIRIALDHEDLSETDVEEITSKVRWMLRLDEDLSEFYDLCRDHPDLAFVAEVGAGRLLRSPTVFEDAVKVLCTTNTNWSQTMAMVVRLCENLGQPYDADPALFSFPDAAAVAARDQAFLEEEIRLGYRAAYLYSLATSVAAGRLDLERLKDPALDSEAVRNLLLKLDGFGPYAVSQLLALIGHYDMLGVDTDMRNFVSRHYFGGAKVTDAEIVRVYHRWGKWKYLVYWAERYWRSFAGSEAG